MSGQAWNFPAPPPPPPPPPVVASPKPPPPPLGFHSSNSYDGRGGRGGNVNHRGRGRGRGDASRGGYQGQYPSSNVNHYSSPDGRYPPVTAVGYQSQTQQIPSNGYQSQGYPTHSTQQQPQYPTQQPTQSYYQPPVTYQQVPSHPQPTGPSYNQNTYPPYQPTYPSQHSPPLPGAAAPQYGNHAAQAPQPQPYPPLPPQPPQKRPSSPYRGPMKPQLMGPPIHWGFNKQKEGRVGGGQRPDFTRDGRHPSHRQNQNLSHSNRPNFRDEHHSRGQKRRHGEAFDKKDNRQPRHQLAPPVPTFGNPLPSKPPPAQDAMRAEEKQGKKPRNRTKKLKLGLTPKGEDHVSSEEEGDDADEETKLAATYKSNGESYQFSHKGHSMSLNSPQEIAAWVAERKKRYPTMAKVEEAKNKEAERQKVHAEAKKARDEALKLKRQEREEAKAKRAKEEAEKARRKAEQADAEDAALKAKIRAEKLRRKLQKEQNRLANAEAAALRARARAEELKNSTIPQREATVDEKKPEIMTEPETTLNQSHLANNDMVPVEDSTSAVKSESDEFPKAYLSPPEDPQPQSPSALSAPSSSTLSISESSSDPGSIRDDDLTSSSESDDSGPEEEPSKKQGNRTKRKEQKQPCAYFQQGRCKKGKHCKFDHDLGKNGQADADRRKGAKKDEGKRKGLYQVMVEKELAEQDEHVLRAIQYLGDHGVLDESPTATAGAKVPDVPTTVESDIGKDKDMPDPKDDAKDTTSTSGNTTLPGTAPGQATEGQLEGMKMEIS